jgi:hypothetical protein
MSDSSSSTSRSLGRRLRAALSDEQVCALLNTVAESGVLRDLDGALRTADPDLADTVRTILDAPGSPALWKDMKACECPGC